MSDCRCASRPAFHSVGFPRVCCRSHAGGVSTLSTVSTCRSERFRVSTLVSQRGHLGTGAWTVDMCSYLRVDSVDTVDGGAER